jgi:hypothetical protein
VGVDAVEAALELSGRFHLDADRAWAGGRRKQVPRRAFGPARNDKWDVSWSKDDVVAFAVAVGREMPKPWRAAARAKASSETSPRGFVVCSRSKGVWEREVAGVGRAWAGRCLRPGDGPLRLRMNLGLGC